MSIKKAYSLNTKITLSFITLGFFLLSILFVQIIPNMKEEQKKEKKNQIENIITLTNEQLKLATELIIHSRKMRIEEIQTHLKTYIEKNIIEFKDKDILLDKLNEKKGCNFSFETNQNNILSNKLFLYTGEQNHICPKNTKEFFYSYKIDDKSRISTKCDANIFINKHNDLEEKLKVDLEKSFHLTFEEHKGKVNLIWINTKDENYEINPLYNIDDKQYNMKYCLSKMSSTQIPQTGKLTAKQIVEASNKEPIFHKLQSKNAYTWIKTIRDDENIKLLFLTTIYEEDLNKSFTSPLLKIIPPAIFSLVIAILLGIFLFKSLFKSINILTNTAKEVNSGNIDIRNNLKGDDDITFLANAFDTMLDSIQENIKTLDRKVEDKTKQLSDSLEEKEVLLKEIHHRVKNNLAMTINLIKLQNRKIEDENTKQILLNIQERIYTMELLHRKLYESEDLSSISFKKYVYELCADLEKTYNNSRDIKIEYDIDDINLNIEYALPCGLIITECLTNTYKYAFDKDKGEIKIKFKIDNNMCSLIISDDGIGLPKDVDFNKSKTLGLRLISSITKGQLLGDFKYVYENGTNFYIDFSIT